MVKPVLKQAVTGNRYTQMRCTHCWSLAETSLSPHGVPAGQLLGNFFVLGAAWFHSELEYLGVVQTEMS